MFGDNLIIYFEIQRYRNLGYSNEPDLRESVKMLHSHQQQNPNLPMKNSNKNARDLYNYCINNDACYTRYISYVE